MRTIIPYYILALLETEGKVVIPGLGEVSRHVHSARIDRDEGVIFPPKASGSMKVGETEKNRLLEQYITYHTGAASSDVRRVLEEFVDSTHRVLSKDGEVNFPGFGRMIVRGDFTYFEPEGNAFNASYADLEIVRRLPDRMPDTEAPPVAAAEPVVERDVHHEPEELHVSRDSVAPSVEHEGSKSAFPAFLIVMLALFIAVCAFAYVQYRISTDTVAEIPVANRSPVSERLKDTNQPEEGILPGSDTGRKEVGISDESVIDPESVEDPVPVDNDTTEPTETTDIESQSSQSEPHYNCMIVVGAFGVKANVDRMIARLSSLGYPVATKPAGSLTQVGVPARCDDNSHLTTLRELRFGIESGAWVLHEDQ